jgi:undecaprenyl-diphosphatase
METLDAVLLGAVQGLTEFLPVSSSGHLVLSKALLGISEPQGHTSAMLLEVALHLGTALAILTFYRARLGALLWASYAACSWQHATADARFLRYLALATLPAIAVALVAKQQIDSLFVGPHAAVIASCCLLINGVLLIGASRHAGGSQAIDGANALWIGVAQAIAILPGISRAGSTIGIALWRGVERERAAEFSLLLGVIAIAGASVLEARDLLKSPTSLPASEWLPLAIGVGTAYFVGLLAIALLLHMLRRGRFAWFGVYCLCVGTFGLLATAAKG